MSAAQVAADRAGWLKARLGDDATGCRIGASEIGTIMRLDGAYGSPYGLWMVKTGRAPVEPEPEPLLAFGTYCENFTAWLTGRRRPDLHITPGGMYHHDARPWQFATFDRLAHLAYLCDGEPCEGDPAAPRRTAVVQLKTGAYRDWHKEGMPLAYRAQVIWEMNIAAVHDGLVPLLNRAAGDLDGIWAIEWDAAAERDLDLMLEAAEAFRDLVRRDRPPKTDGLPATTLALIQRYPDLNPAKTARVPYWLARRWRRAARAEARHKASKKRYENELRARAGDAGTWTTWDPGRGEVKIATHTAGPRAGYHVDPSPRVDSVNPSRSFNP
jgi:hypothetical protein